MKRYNRIRLLLAGILVVLAAMLVSVQPVMSINTTDVSATVTVNVIVDVTLANTTLTFTGLTDGSTDNLPTEYPINVTVETTTNTPTNLSIKSSTSTFSGPGTLGIGNLTYTNESTGTDQAMSATYGDGSFADWQTIIDPVGSSELRQIYTELDIPAGLASGTYTATITVRVREE